MSDSVLPQRRQPTRLPRPWDSPGKNTGVGCYFLLHCVKAKSESEVTQSCLTCSKAMDCSLPGSSIHGIFQARVLEWGAIAIRVCKFLAEHMRSSHNSTAQIIIKQLEMGKGPEQIFFQKRYTNSQKEYKKVFKVTYHQRNANQTHNEISPHTC